MANTIRDINIYNFHSKHSFAFVLLKRISDFEKATYQLQRNKTHRQVRGLVKLVCFVQNLERRMLPYLNAALFSVSLVFE